MAWQGIIYNCSTESYNAKDKFRSQKQMAYRVLDNSLAGYSFVLFYYHDSKYNVKCFKVNPIGEI